MDPTAIIALATEIMKFINNNQGAKTTAQVKAESLFWLELIKPLIYLLLTDDQKKAFDQLEAALKAPPNA